MRTAWREKQTRRVENAKAKRDMINNQVAKERFVEANTKIRRIRDLSCVKESQKAERRDNAIRHQEMLKSYLETEKANRKDDRPMQYATDANTSAFGANTSAYESMRAGGSRSVSPSPNARNNDNMFKSQSVLSNERSRSRPWNKSTAKQPGTSPPRSVQQKRARGQPLNT